MSTTWHVGDLAECYSVTHAEWCRGEVVDLKSDGVVVRYHIPGGMLGCRIGVHPGEMVIP
jgi:hypothetical protein